MALVSVYEILASSVVLAWAGGGLQIAWSGRWSGRRSGYQFRQSTFGQIVDAIAPVGKLLSSQSAIALRVGIFMCLSVFSEGVGAPALTVPLKTSVFEAFIFAMIEAFVLFVDVEEFSGFSVLHVTVTFVDPASFEGRIDNHSGGLQ
jgi:hypothetical protein